MDKDGGDEGRTRKKRKEEKGPRVRVLRPHDLHVTQRVIDFSPQPRRMTNEGGGKQRNKKKEGEEGAKRRGCHKTPPLD